MSSNGGSSGGSSSSSGGSSSDREKKAPSPVAQSSAPRGAYLGTTTGSGVTGNAGIGAGASLVSNGDGTATSLGGTSGGSSNDGRINVTLPTPARTESTPTETKYFETAAPAVTPPTVSVGGSAAQTLYPTQGEKTGAVDTTVTQKPVGGGPAAPVDGPEGTTVAGGPRSDFSVVLAGQTGKRPERSAARSNNFVSLVGGAGGLGRKTSEAKRSLIGGA